MGETIDYRMVLTDLEAKRDALDMAITGLRKLLASERPTIAVRENYADMDWPTAIEQFLRTKGSSQTVPVIITGLLSGGFTTTSKTPNRVLSALLTYMKRQGKVINAGREWRLTEGTPSPGESPLGAQPSKYL